jgi:hypothetical protein
LYHDVKMTSVRIMYVFVTSQVFKI